VRGGCGGWFRIFGLKKKKEKKTVKQRFAHTGSDTGSMRGGGIKKWDGVWSGKFQPQGGGSRGKKGVGDGASGGDVERGVRGLAWGAINVKLWPVA